jgi:ABC-type multidrug transport system ATPase subunit
MTRMIRTTRSTSGEIPFGQPLKSVERGLLAICPQDIVVWSDLTCQQNLALMRNLYDHIRNSKGNPENRIEDLLRRPALARGVVIRCSLADSL